MNYTLKEANKLRVGDTLTLEDGTVHEAVKGRIDKDCTIELCSIKEDCDNCNVACAVYRFHFKQMKP
jgi:hypothetical protein